ncbi:hypothetical protein HWV62_6291 [Athelia sp. TMB]|nr:hypothetical protein HWV62_38955 [Athelia sp. TMB]KAF7976496.1 hypothetical protein HWV62_6291 [Athelia sp. TMB]
MSHPSSPAKEGTVPFPFRGETHQTFYKLYGSLSSAPTEHNARPPALTLIMHRRKNSDANTTWSIVSKLHTIRVPTLVLNGAYDFETDLVCAPFLEHIEGSRWVKFENSSHMMHWEEREKYTNVVDGFLGEHKDRKERK